MKKTYSPEEARVKIHRYCAYQERCHQDVRIRLFQYGLTEAFVDELIADLITNGFLNEERFARTFAGGKFRIKKWGRLKIIQALEARGLSAHCIKAGLTEIDEDEYAQTLEGLLEKRRGDLVAPNIFVLRDRLSKYAIQRGFEPNIVWTLLKEMIPDHK